MPSAIISAFTAAELTSATVMKALMVAESSSEAAPYTEGKSRQW